MIARFETPQGRREVEGSYLLACDGGRSTVRAELGVPVEGVSHDVRYMLVDIEVDTPSCAAERCSTWATGF